MNYKKILSFGMIISALLSPSAGAKTGEITGLSFLGEYKVPTSFAVEGIPFGGLSAIRWHDAEQRFYAISDSRNTEKEGKPRVYALKIDLSAAGINNVTVENQYALLDANGEIFKKGSVDAEGMVITPDNQLLWSSETGSPLRVSTLGGKFIADLAAVLPEAMSLTGENEHEGFRNGISWEGLTLTPDKKFLFMAGEGALKQDGPLASPINSSPVRILKFRYPSDETKPKLESVYLYNVDPVSHISRFGINDNGISEILALNDNQLLVIERSGRNVSEGYNDWDFSIKVWLADTSTGTNIKDIPSLSALTNKGLIQPVTKKLLIDFSTLTDAPDCIEGVTFGPLIDGKKTLLFVSDNNFQPHQSTKFYLFQDQQGVLK
ncbi:MULTISPECIES: esterase-like activity of phytase family protein [unclassified Leclercia]|uniref:Esterase-like activity of phytase family protein n=1 Tax=Leclercia barmai TaxID=2785629 RepID=A0ABS7RXF1_9ENTR|nr:MULTISPECIES: esterase-like activity of phytase family protein [unclassified Leclercia]MBZ0058981.1 esterase-like activity of phytase family protein [Leclercia sp. EMC7]MCM5697017.1 esterase-like activity of phytase family protein [Leclercia sp. LTM01]MCM5701153.1 esterase-like activity of phytase family protein [Leclercia sp. LTM14]